MDNERINQTNAIKMYNLTPKNLSQLHYILQGKSKMYLKTECEKLKEETEKEKTGKQKRKSKEKSETQVKKRKFKETQRIDLTPNELLYPISDEGVHLLGNFLFKISSNEPGLLRKAMALADAKRMGKVLGQQCSSALFFCGTVGASMKKHVTYKSQALVTEQNLVCSCTCPVGKDICSHCLALAVSWKAKKEGCMIFPVKKRKNALRAKDLLNLFSRKGNHLSFFADQFSAL